MDTGPALLSRSQSPSLSSQPGGQPGLSSSKHTTTKHPLPWFSESYFSNEPATAAARKVYIVILTSRGILLILFIFSVLSIYWGALWQTPTHVYNLNGWVVDFDGGEVGQFVSRAVVASSGSPTAITWNAVSTELFPNGTHDLEDAVVQEKAWVIIAISPNATETLNTAVIVADNTYISNRTVSVYTAEARSENAYRMVVHPNVGVNTLLDGITEAFNAQYITGVPRKSPNLTTLLVNAPMLVSQPISYTIINARPFDVPVATAVDFVGLIYLLILSFVVAMAHYVARVDATHLEDRLTFEWLIVIRIVNPVIMYFFISCFYSLLSVAFQVPFNRYYGSSGFVIYWMMSWLAMCALGGAVESMMTILTPRFIPFFLLLWIIVNVSVCIFPPTLLPGVYHYGYATPFYNVQRTVRAIIFGTRNQIGLNFGVQIAWTFLSWCTLILFQYIKRRQSIRAYEVMVGTTIEPKSDEP
ncbi:hypothetical protein B0F90DRAFT_1624843 [Multifurca ochricompacta]|uniref:DUF3533 domain-containing protein n=1 Tax=Multifurca ochricompacta TaxID=376703 RepID=A0AAD4QQX0_9AGAM|nr:hypothetical protein B0F90DRAFT_1624843 [Multifurca ochricompacta]